MCAGFCNNLFEGIQPPGHEDTEMKLSAPYYARLFTQHVADTAGMRVFAAGTTVSARNLDRSHPGKARSSSHNNVVLPASEENPEMATVVKLMILESV